MWFLKAVKPRSLRTKIIYTNFKLRLTDAEIPSFPPEICKNTTNKKEVGEDLPLITPNKYCFREEKYRSLHAHKEGMKWIANKYSVRKTCLQVFIDREGLG